MNIGEAKKMAVNQEVPYERLVRNIDHKVLECHNLVDNIRALVSEDFEQAPGHGMVCPPMSPIIKEQLQLNSDRLCELVEKLRYLEDLLRSNLGDLKLTS